MRGAGRLSHRHSGFPRAEFTSGRWTLVTRGSHLGQWFGNLPGLQNPLPTRCTDPPEHQPPAFQREGAFKPGRHHPPRSRTHAGARGGSGRGCRMLGWAGGDGAPQGAPHLSTREAVPESIHRAWAAARGACRHENGAWDTSNFWMVANHLRFGPHVCFPSQSLDMPFWLASAYRTNFGLTFFCWDTYCGRNASLSMLGGDKCVHSCTLNGIPGSG